MGPVPMSCGEGGYCQWLPSGKWSKTVRKMVRKMVTKTVTKTVKVEGSKVPLTDY